MKRPADLFDRSWEWEQLTRFATDDAAGSTLGVVTGPRRQGKTFLLQALCEQSGGFFYEAIEGTEAESLRHFGQQFAAFTGMPAPAAFDSWEAALDAVFELGRSRPALVVIDEFPYLVRATPALPSLIQAALAPRSRARTRLRTRLLLCGSAASFMGKLLSGSAPLRGRAGLDLVIQTFDYRTAANFWGLRDEPRLALLIHSIVGGTPAYRREFVSNEAPRSSRDFDGWVVKHVLSPSSPLFREGRYLLAEEPGLRDVGPYHSILSAVAAGHTTHGAIATTVGRGAHEISHALSVLEDSGFLLKSQDALRKRRPVYSIREPILAFYHAIMRPEWPRLERPGYARQLWQESRQKFLSSLVGPHFERVCREWAATFAPSSLFGGEAVSVGHATLNDRSGRSQLELDVVVTAPGASRGRARVLAIGEAKWGEKVGESHIARLHRALTLLEARGDLDLTGCRLLLFSGAGFTRTRGAVDASTGDRVALVGLDEIYG